MEKEHRKSTLMNYTKEQLVEHIMCLEHNNNVLEENFNRQYENCMKLLNDMNLINDTYKNRKIDRCDVCVNKGCKMLKPEVRHLAIKECKSKGFINFILPEKSED